MLFCPDCPDQEEFIAFDCAIIVDSEGDFVTAASNEAYDELSKTLGESPEPIEFICNRCGKKAKEEEI